MLMWIRIRCYHVAHLRPRAFTGSCCIASLIHSVPEEERKKKNFSSIWNIDDEAKLHRRSISPHDFPHTVKMHVLTRLKSISAFRKKKVWWSCTEMDRHSDLVSHQNALFLLSQPRSFAFMKSPEQPKVDYIISSYVLIAERSAGV